MTEIKWMQQPCQQQQGGGGTIIIRRSIKQALNDPLVHGLIPTNEVAVVDSILAKDENDWTMHETHKVAKVFHWVAMNT